MAAALRFYGDTLGFTKTFVNGSPIGFVILKRDEAELHLTLAKDHMATPRYVAHILVSDARALHDTLVGAAVRIIKAPRDVTDGMTGFVFADPDGNRIDVGQGVIAGSATT